MGRSGRVGFDGPAFDVSEAFCDGGAGNREAEFDGSADGIGDEVSSLHYGSCGGRGRRREPSSSQHRTLYILCLTRSPSDRLMHSDSGSANKPRFLPGISMRVSKWSSAIGMFVLYGLVHRPEFPRTQHDRLLVRIECKQDTQFRKQTPPPDCGTSAAPQANVRCCVLS